MDESLLMNGTDNDIVLKTLTEYNEDIALVLGSLANKRRLKLAETCRNWCTQTHRLSPDDNAKVQRQRSD